jgi:hypothetical protein
VACSWTASHIVLPQQGQQDAMSGALRDPQPARYFRQCEAFRVTASSSIIERARQSTGTDRVCPAKASAGSSGAATPARSGSSMRVDRPVERLGRKILR